MDKQLYYRIMVPASLLSVCLFLFLIFLFDQSSVSWLCLVGWDFIITFFIRKENLLLFI